MNVGIAIKFTTQASNVQSGNTRKLCAMLDWQISLFMWKHMNVKISMVVEI